RSSVRTSPKRAEAALRPITAPTLVIWGERDRYLSEELAEPDHDDVPNADRGYGHRHAAPQFLIRPPATHTRRRPAQQSRGGVRGLE
ncbi:MAG TPA: alpha/beta hydrolase, partial [Streptosporangiaceae bacterium]